MIGYTQLFLILSVATFVSTEKIFVIGYFGIEIFDTVKNVSQAVKSMPLISGSATTSLNGQIYIVGGWSDPNIFGQPTFYKFNVTDGSTSSGPFLNYGRYGHGITKTSKEIFVCGGSFDLKVTTNTCEKFNGKNWTLIGNLPKKLKGLKMATLNDIPYTFGGSTADDDFVDNVYAYEKATNSWKQVATLPKKIANHGVVALDSSRALICGGNTIYQDKYDTLNECNIFDADTNTFINNPYKLKIPLKGFGFVNVKGTIYRLNGDSKLTPEFEDNVTDTISMLTPTSKESTFSIYGRLIYFQDLVSAAVVE